MAKSLIYLDHAAATPLDSSVLAAMQPYWSKDFYNPSATYLPAQTVHKALETARSRIAHWLGARPAEIIFTAGGSEANNLAIHGVMRQHPKGNIVVSSIEHESVLVPAHEYECREVKVQPDGRLDPDDLARKIDSQTVLVSIMYANNEIGTIQPIREVAKLVKAERKSRKTPLYLHTDAAQATNYLDLHAARLGVDLMTINGGKIYGPKQTGALYVKAGLQLLPLVQGGGQERDLRSGTENVAGSIGLARALDMVQSDRHQEAKRLEELQSEFIKLIKTKIPQALVNGSIKFRLPNNVHLTLPGKDNERVLIQLEQAGILGAAGSACSASNEEPSHVLRAIGLTDQAAQASLRFTMGRTTTISEIKRAVEALAKLA